VFACRPYTHPLTLSKYVLPATYQVQALKAQAYSQSTILRWQRLHKNPLSRVTHPEQFVSPHQAFRSLSSNPFSNRRLHGDPVESDIKIAETCSWPALYVTNNLGVPPIAVHRSCWSGVSLEDDLVHNLAPGKGPTIHGNAGTVPGNVSWHNNAD
jgi:hypothetical protein